MSNEQRAMSNEQAPTKLARAKLRRVFLCYLLFAICYLLFSCQSAVKTPDETPYKSGFLPLDTGASAYILTDVPGARPILDGISYIPTHEKRVKQMLDKTRSAVAAVYLPSSEETRRFHLASWGSYPASGAKFAFGTSKDWKKQRSASSKSAYWHSEKSQMSIAVTPARAYVLAAMDIAPHDPMPHPQGIKIPEGFVEFGKGSALSCWLSNPGPVLNQKLLEMGIPLEIPAEQLFLCLIPRDGQKYEANVKITFQHAGQARIVANLLFIARRNFIPSSVPQPLEKNANGSSAQDNAAMLSYLLFANPVVQEASSLLLKPPPLSVDEIALLFSMFSL